jgi:hypothetical protein
MAYKHGVSVTEQATSIIAPVSSSAGLQVVLGTAPVNLLADPYSATNTPLLCNSYAEAVAAVGYSTDFAKYTLCQSIYATFQVVNVAPIILINVLDPTKHVAAVDETECQINDGVAVLEVEGVLLDKLVVKAGGKELTADEDYVAAFDDDGFVTIALPEGGAAGDATALTVSGKRIAPEAVTAEDIVGGVDGNGKETGTEVIRQIFPKLNLVPGSILAPGWSKNALVSAALQAKTTNLNGSFRCLAVVDVDSGANGCTQYADVLTQKQAQGLTSAYCYAVWLYAKVGDYMIAGSAMAAAQMAYIDSQNGDIPSVSPSNKAISITAACLEDGTEVLLDEPQANTVNSYGVATWLNMLGFRLWGNNTCIYPSSTDPKDRFVDVRRFFNWDDNTFIQTYYQKVDNPMNKRLIEALVDSENLRGNSFVSRGICARYELVYDSDENPLTDLLNGTIRFHKYCTKYVPAENIEEIVEFDADALATALS